MTEQEHIIELYRLVAALAERVSELEEWSYFVERPTRRKWRPFPRNATKPVTVKR